MINITKIINLTIWLIIITIIVSIGILLAKSNNSKLQAKTLTTDLSYIDIPLIDKFQNKTIGWKNIDPKCKKECVKTLEIYDIIDEMNQYIKDTKFKANNITDKNDFISQLLNQMKSDKIKFDAAKI